MSSWFATLVIVGSHAKLPECIKIFLSQVAIPVDLVLLDLHKSSNVSALKILMKFQKFQIQSSFGCRASLSRCSWSAICTDNNLQRNRNRIRANEVLQNVFLLFLRAFADPSKSSSSWKASEKREKIWEEKQLQSCILQYYWLILKIYDHDADMLLIWCWNANYMPLPSFPIITLCVSYIEIYWNIGFAVLHSASSCFIYGAPGASAPAFQTKASPSDCTSSTFCAQWSMMVYGWLWLICG